MIETICKPCDIEPEFVPVEKLPDALCPVPETPEERNLLGRVRYDEVLTDTYLDALRKVLREHNCEITPATPMYRPPMIDGKPKVATYLQPYSFRYKAVEGEEPYTFDISGDELPLGITFNPLTGALSGIPTETGRFNFIIRVRDNRRRSSSMFTHLDIVG